MNKLFRPAALALGLMPLASCGQGEHVTVAEKFAKSFAALDYEEAKKYGDEQTNKLIDFMGAVVTDSVRQAEGKDLKFRLISDSVSGDSAWVRFVDANDVENDTTEFVLTKVEGEWKVKLMPDK